MRMFFFRSRISVALAALAVMAAVFARPAAGMAEKPPKLDALRKELLDLVNHDRRLRGLLPVEMDSVASRAGQKHAEDMAEKDYFSHISPDGRTPFHRYAEEGGTDHVQENIFFNAWKGAPINVYDRIDMEQAEKALMNSPGHRANILTPSHTHVGFGVAVNPETQSIYVAQEFIDRYAEMRPVTGVYEAGEEMFIKGRMIYVDYGPYFLALTRSPLPDSGRQWDQPPPSGPYLDASKDKILSKGPWDFDFDNDSGWFTISFKLPDDAPEGLYYLQIFAKEGVDKIPYHPTRSMEARTEGSVPATGIVFRVY